MDKMKPLEFWCHHVLPLVYDDSMSYYEVLCKMQSLINEQIEHIESAETAAANAVAAVGTVEADVTAANDTANNALQAAQDAQASADSAQLSADNAQTSADNIIPGGGTKGKSLYYNSDVYPELRWEKAAIQLTGSEMNNQIGQHTGETVQCVEDGYTYVAGAFYKGSATGWTAVSGIAYELPQAGPSELGGIKADHKTANETSEVKIDPATGKLYSVAGGGGASYQLPQAAEGILGGVKAASRTSVETAEVKIDPATGKLYSKPGAGAYTLPQATEGDLGGIKAANKSPSDTSEIKIDPATGKLYGPDTAYTLPQATAANLGGIRAAAKGAGDTKEVKIESATGKLYVEDMTYNLPQASSNNLGGVKADVSNENLPVIVAITSDGHLRGALESAYSSGTGIGGVKLTAKTDNMISPVGMNSDGELFSDPESFSQATALPASGTALSKNKLYLIPNTAKVGTYQFVGPASGEAHGIFYTDATVSITFGAGEKFLGEAPALEANKQYEFDVLEKVWTFTEVVTA